jgi:hypothetical protein
MQEARPPAAALRPWLIAWLGGVLIGIGNGALREVVIARRVSELRAEQLSVLSGIGAFAGYHSLLQRRWPLGSNREALEVGAAWGMLTILFEFSFGRLVTRRSWSELLGAYDLRRGRLWPLMLLWICLGPLITTAIRRRRGG